VAMAGLFEHRLQVINACEVDLTRDGDGRL
jgi:hypothetical protein